MTFRGGERYKGREACETNAVIPCGAVLSGGPGGFRFQKGALNRNMTREAIEAEIRKIFLQEFEIEDPAMDVDLREAYQFDSIDAIELLVEIERFLGSELTMEEKKRAMDIRTFRQICAYVEQLAQVRRAAGNLPIGDLCKEGS